jgi:hypothetical protein
VAQHPSVIRVRSSVFLRAFVVFCPPATDFVEVGRRESYEPDAAYHRFRLIPRMAKRSHGWGDEIRVEDLRELPKIAYYADTNESGRVSFLTASPHPWDYSRTVALSP